MLEIIVQLAPYATALAAIFTVYRSNKNQLAAAYFNRMADAYAAHWRAFNAFFFDPNESARAAYAASVCTACMFASEKAACEIQSLYAQAVAHSSTCIPSAAQLDDTANALEQTLRAELRSFQNRKGDLFQKR